MSTSSAISRSFRPWLRSSSTCFRRSAARARYSSRDSAMLRRTVRDDAPIRSATSRAVRVRRTGFSAPIGGLLPHQIAVELRRSPTIGLDLRWCHDFAALAPAGGLHGDEGGLVDGRTVGPHV